MSDDDDNVLRFPRPWERDPDGDQPFWHVIRNEHSKNFKALIVTAISKKTGDAASYGTFPMQECVDEFIEAFNFDRTIDQSDPDFEFVISKINQIRLVPEEELIDTDF